MWFLVFPILTYLGSGFSSIWAGIDLEYLRNAKVIDRNAWQTKCHGRGSRVSNDTRDFDNCGLCCVFLWGGERRWEFLKEKQFRCKVKREERSLQKLKDTERYEGFRQVHDIHKYFDKISVSVACSVCPTCHHCRGFWWFWANFFAVLWFWMIFLRFCSF